MFIISKRNFLVRRADGTLYKVVKDFIGDIPDDVYNSGTIQGAIKGGYVAIPENHKDKAIDKAVGVAKAKEETSDKRPDAKRARK